MADQKTTLSVFYQYARNPHTCLRGLHDLLRHGERAGEFKDEIARVYGRPNWLRVDIWDLETLLRRYLATTDRTCRTEYYRTTDSPPLLPELRTKSQWVMFHATFTNELVRETGHLVQSYAYDLPLNECRVRGFKLRLQTIYQTAHNKTKDMHLGDIGSAPFFHFVGDLFEYLIENDQLDKQQAADLMMEFHTKEPMLCSISNLKNRSFSSHIGGQATNAQCYADKINLDAFKHASMGEVFMKRSHPKNRQSLVNEQLAYAKKYYLPEKEHSKVDGQWDLNKLETLYLNYGGSKLDPAYQAIRGRTADTIAYDETTSLLHPTQPPLPKDDDMKIEHITFVNDVPVKELSEDAIFNAIRTAEEAIDKMNETKNKPKSLQARIKKFQANIDELVAYLDAKTPDDSTAVEA